METLFPRWSLKCIYMYIKIFTGPGRVCMLVWAGGGQAMKAVGIWVGYKPPDGSRGSDTGGCWSKTRYSLQYLCLSLRGGFFESMEK